MMSGSTDTPENAAARVGVRTLWMFLRGDREAILNIASAKGMLVIGVLFVLSAALAREYDGADLVAEPWHLVLPLLASLVTSFLLFSLLFGVGKLRGIGAVPFGRSYLRFLAVYWMTAPLAWLYAIPVEAFMRPYEATLSNLTLLGAVSIWRVALMARVVQCLFNTTGVAAWSVVLFFADTVALAAIAVTPMPVISIMGGISHTEAEIAILNLTLMVGFACVVSLPVWFFSTVGVAFQGAKWEFALTGANRHLRPTSGLRWFSAAAVGAWAIALPTTQPKQRLAHRVNHDLKAGNIKEAVREMASHDRSDFPARWDPPPHIGYGQREPAILDVMEALLAADAPASTRAVFTEKFGNTLYNTSFLSPDNMDDKELARYVNVLLQLPEGPSFASRKEGFIEMAYGHPENSEARRDALKALLDLAKTYDPTRDASEQFARSY